MNVWNLANGEANPIHIDEWAGGEFSLAQQPPPLLGTNMPDHSFSPNNVCNGRNLTTRRRGRRWWKKKLKKKKPMKMADSDIKTPKTLDQSSLGPARFYYARLMHSIRCNHSARCTLRTEKFNTCVCVCVWSGKKCISMHLSDTSRLTYAVGCWSFVIESRRENEKKQWDERVVFESPGRRQGHRHQTTWSFYFCNM